MSDSKTVTVPTFFLTVLVGLAAVGVVALLIAPTTDSWHDEAVKAGKAEYYLDEHSNKKWRWKP